MEEKNKKFSKENLVNQFKEVTRSYLSDRLLMLSALRLAHYHYKGGNLNRNVVAGYRQHVLDIRESIKQELAWICERTIENMTVYMHEYRVKADSVDHLKISYWFSDAVCELFDGRKRDITKVALLLNMNNLLKHDTDGQSIHDDMFEKIMRSYIQRKAEYNLGHYGVYMIFKNCSLLCRKQCKLEKPDS